MQFGVLNMNKPAGMTSRQAVDVVKRLVRPAKCGHAGTLDPLASGVLVVCIGPATRLISYVQQMRKVYRATFQLGRSSPTDDIEGEVTPLAGAVEPTSEQIAAVIPRFLGTIEQRPPVFSAVKVAGRRAYALARRGKEVELAAKLVQIHRLEIRRYAYPELELDIECGSGTYVRALGRDLAAALGAVAVMSALERTAIGGYRLDDANCPAQINAESLAAYMLPALSAVAHLPRVMLNDAERNEIRHGRSIAAADGQSADALHSEAAGVDRDGKLAAILSAKKPGEWWPLLNFG
jgi:tRNA pseudouridine55 synthase